MSYQSPFSTRYASDEMRAIWSEKAQRILWRRVWIAVAEAQSTAGLVTREQVEDLKSQATNIDLGRAYEIEDEIGHDLVAELQTFAEQCPQGGPILHWGMTSADVKDNADILRQHTALSLLLRGMRRLLLRFADQIHEYSDLAVMGYTHLQPAEPTTLGFRLAVYAQDIAAHFENLARLRNVLQGKGIRGSVGTAATFKEMLPEPDLSGDLLDPQANKRHRAERAADKNKARFWSDAIVKGRALREDQPRNCRLTLTQTRTSQSCARQQFYCP